MWSSVLVVDPVLTLRNAGLMNLGLRRVFAARAAPADLGIRGVLPVPDAISGEFAVLGR